MSQINQALNTSISKHSSAIHPHKDSAGADHSQRLPPEMLYKIFLQTLPDDRLQEYHRYMAQAMGVSQVCATWRALALECRPLWTHLRFVTFSTLELEAVKAWLIRSGRHPLAFSVGYHAGTVLQPSISPVAWENALDLLIPQCRRWKEAHFFLWKPVQGTTTSPLTNNLPLLQKLSIPITHDWGIPQGFHVAPRLRQLSLQPMDGSHVSQLPWTDLTGLNIHDLHATGDCFSVLLHLPKLVAVNLKFSCGAMETGSHIPHVELAFLMDLEIESEEDSVELVSFWDHFTFPSLSRLQLLGSWTNNVGCRKLASMLVRSSSTNPLTSLVLGVLSPLGAQGVEVGDVVDVLHAVPGIKSLSLFGFIYGRQGGNCLFTALTASESRHLAPKLETLELSLSHPMPSSDTNLLADMIESRRTCGPLQSVHILRPFRNVEIFDQPIVARVKALAAEGFLTADGPVGTILPVMATSTHP